MEASESCCHEVSNRVPIIWGWGEQAEHAFLRLFYSLLLFFSVTSLLQDRELRQEAGCLRLVVFVHRHQQDLRQTILTRSRVGSRKKSLLETKHPTSVLNTTNDLDREFVSCRGGAKLVAWCLVSHEFFRSQLPRGSSTPRKSNLSLSVDHLVLEAVS